MTPRQKGQVALAESRATVSRIEPDKFVPLGQAAAKVVEKLGARMKPKTPGIYFNLDENEYHRDPAIGSTDIRKLLRSAPDYWWESWMNPLRPPLDADTPARERGRAMHKFVWEGQAPFQRIYIRRPDDAEGATSGQKGALTKATKERLQPGQTMLKGDDYDRIMVAGQMIAKHPELGDAFTNGFHEVSVFWESGGLMYKARFDYLKPRGIGDLKSITNSMGKDFVAACRGAIANYRYDIQAAHYLEARKHVAELFAAGLVYGLSTERSDFDLLKSIADEKEYAFVFVFFQAEDAPITWGCILSPGNPILDASRHDINKAIDRYKEFMVLFGDDQIWLMSEPVAELNYDEMPAWFGRT